MRSGLIKRRHVHLAGHATVPEETAAGGSGVEMRRSLGFRVLGLGFREPDA